MKNVKLSLIFFYFKIKSGIINIVGKDRFPIIMKKFKVHFYEIDSRIEKEKGIMAFHRVFLILGLALLKKITDLENK